MRLPFFAALVGYFDDSIKRSPPVKRGRRRGPSRRSFLEQLEDRRMMSADYKVQIIGGFHAQAQPGDSPLPTGSLSLAYSANTWGESSSENAGIFGLLSGSVTSGEGVTYNIGPGADPTIFSIQSEIAPGNTELVFNDPQNGYGGHFDLKVTDGTLNENPPCDCYRDLLAATGGDGGHPAFNGSPDGALADTAGNPNFAVASFGGSNFGTVFGVTTRLNNQPMVADPNSDPSVTVSQIPHVDHIINIDNGSTEEYAIADAGQVRIFDKGDSGYIERHLYNDRFDKLLFDPLKPGYLRFTDTAGDTYVFNDFSDQRPLLQQGELYEIIDPGGNIARVPDSKWNSDGQPTEVVVTSADGTVNDTYDFFYESGQNRSDTNYGQISSGRNANDPNAGELSGVTLTRQGVAIESASFVYYPVSDTDTLPGMLKFETISEWVGNQWVKTDTTYFRHDASGNISYVFLNDSYTLLKTAFGDQATIDGTDDQHVAPYADVQVTYGSDGYISEIKAKGSGCSVCAGGLGDFTYKFATNFGVHQGYNVWGYEMTETMPGSTVTVYANFAGEVLLSDQQNVGGQDWITAYKYDGAGRVIETINPSAVDTSGTPYTVNSDGTITVALNATKGLIEHTDYWDPGASYTITTITGSTVSPADSGGGAKGYVKDDWIEQGSTGRYAADGVNPGTGNWTYTDYTTYYNVTHTYSIDSTSALGYDVPLSPVASTTVFPQQFQGDLSSLPSTAETTKYAYTFYPESVWEQQVTETLPNVSDQASGGTGDTVMTYLDKQGRPRWTKAANGTINFTSYDVATGAPREEVDDVDTTTGNSLWVGGLPTGFTPTSGSHLNQGTLNVIDGLGRTVIHVVGNNIDGSNPNGSNDATFTLYDDPDHEVRVYTGWKYTPGSGGLSNPANFSQDTTAGALPPVQVEIDNLPLTPECSGLSTIIDGQTVALAGSYSQILTMAQPAASSSTAITENGVTLPIGGQPGTGNQAGTQVLADIANVRSLSVAIQNQAGQTVETDDYYNLTTDYSQTGNPNWAYSAGPNPHLGTAWNHLNATAAANYYATTYAYGDLGGLEREQNANGVIRHAVHDDLGRLVSLWIGTNDEAGSSDPEWSPDNQGPNSDMAEIAAYVYDNGGAADSNVTQVTEYPDSRHLLTSPQPNRVTTLYYDWRDRLVASKMGDDTDTTTQLPITYYALDNLGEVTNEYVYSGSNVDPQTIINALVANPSAPNFNGQLQSDVWHHYDARGREYATDVYKLDQYGNPGTTAYATTSYTFDANDNVVNVQDPMSNITTFTFDGLDRMTSRLDPAPGFNSTSNAALTKYGYDIASNVKSVIDPNNNETDYKYDAANRLFEIDQPQTNILQSGATDASVAPTAQATLYHTNVIPKTTYSYNDAGLVAAVTDPNGNQAASPYSTSFNYDALGRTISVVSPQVYELSAGSNNTASPTPGYPTRYFGYDGDSNIVSSTDANNQTTNYKVDMFDNVVKIAPPGDSLSGSVPTTGTSYTFDNLGDLVGVQTADGTTNFAYNTLGQQYQVTQPQLASALLSNGTSLTGYNPVTSYTFDALGNVATMTDPNANYLIANGYSGYSTQYFYDSLSRLTSIVQPAPSGSGTSPTTSYGYNTDSELTSVKDPLGNQTTIDWYNNGLKRQLTLPVPSTGIAAPVYKYDYFAGGQLKKVTDPFSNITSYTYTASNQLSTVTLPTITYPNNNPAPVTPVISYFYDANGNQTAETDPDSNSTFYNYDALNRLSDKREFVATNLDPNTGYTTQVDQKVATYYAYDPNGNLTRMTDPDGRVIGYDYNGLGQRTAENWFTGAGVGNASNTIGYDYYNGGELHHATDAFNSTGNETWKNSAYTFGIDALGRVTSVDNNDPSTTGTAGVPDVVLNAQYDLNGNRTQLSATVGFNGQTSTNDFLNTYGFDRLNRETSVVQTSNGGYGVGYKKTNFNYYDDGRLQTITDYKDSTTQAATGNLSYDHDGRLTGLSWYGLGAAYGGGSGYFEQISWGYDSDSRVGTMSNASHTNENLTYQYNQDSELTSAAASYGGYGGGYGGGTYSWDANGDPTGKTIGKGNRLLADGTYRYWYDNSGHLKTRIAINNSTTPYETDYAWDNRGRLMSATDKNSSNTTLQVIAYAYDAFNDLIARTVTPYSNGSPVNGSITTARFIYDLTGSIVDLGVDPTTAGNPAAGAGEGQAVLAFNGNQSLTDRYLWGPAVDELLADERFSPSGSNWMPPISGSGGTVYWALTDNENSVRDWITYGNLVDHIVYDSFGKIFSQSNTSVPFAFMHNGVFYDPATGLEYHSQPGTSLPGRWYNPVLQRWMSKDASGLAPDSNPYRDDGNSPTNYVDPSGLEKREITISIGFATEWKSQVAEVANEFQADVSTHVDDPVTGSPDWDAADKDLVQSFENSDTVTTCEKAGIRTGASLVIMSGHGGPGAIGPLNSNALDDPKVINYMMDLRSMLMRDGNNNIDATIVLRSCKTAAGPEGKAFMLKLAKITGAKVVAFTGTYAIRPGGEEYTAYPDGRFQKTDDWGNWYEKMEKKGREENRLAKDLKRCRKSDKVEH